LGSLTEHEGLLRRFRADEGFCKTEFDCPDPIRDFRQPCRGFTRMSMLRLRRGICGATDVAAGLDKTGLELGEERGQGRLSAES